MSVDIDFPPLYDVLVKTMNGKLYWADSQRDWMAAFVQTISTYLTSGGIFLPQLTTVQRDALQSPVNGQLIYNVTTNKLQGYENGAWVNLV